MSQLYTQLPIKQITVDGNNADQLLTADNADRLIIKDTSASINKFITVQNLLASGANAAFSTIKIKDNSNMASHSWGDASQLGISVIADSNIDTLEIYEDSAQGVKLQADATDDAIKISMENASATQKGVASFNTNHFTVSSGAVAADPIAFTDGTNAGDISLGGSVTIQGTSKEVESAHNGSGQFTIGLPSDVVVSASLSTPKLMNADESLVITLDDDGNGANVIVENGLQVKGNEIHSSAGQAIVFSGVNTTIKGNLQVDGTTTTVNSTTVQIDDKNIQLGDGSANDAAMDGAGIDVASASGTLASWRYDQPNSYWESSADVNVVTAYYVNGTSMLTSAGAAKVQGGVAGDGLSESNGVLKLDFSSGLNSVSGLNSKDDYISFYDDSASAHVTVTFDDLTASLASGPGLAQNSNQYSLALDISEIQKNGGQSHTAAEDKTANNTENPITLSTSAVVEGFDRFYGYDAGDSDASLFVSSQAAQTAGAGAFLQVFANGALLRGGLIDSSSMTAAFDSIVNKVKASELDYFWDEATSSLYYKAQQLDSGNDYITVFIAS